MFFFIENLEKKFSYANALAEYELWVQNVSDNRPQITCNEQKVLMSEYQFETDKDPDAEQTLGDGGDMEEVLLRLLQYLNLSWGIIDFLILIVFI